MDARFICVVARREIDADAFGCALDERVLKWLNKSSWQEFCREAIRIAHDLREMLIHHVIHRRVQVLIVVGRADVNDVGVGRHAVNRFYVERFFAIPSLRILPWILWTVVRARRHHLRERAATGRPELRNHAIS